MSRGRTRKGRARRERALLAPPAAKPLLQAEDHGREVRLDPAAIGATGDRWIEPFLDANRSHLERLQVTPRVETRGGLALAFRPGSRIGAVPLLSPANRRVCAGLLVRPRFRWSALGAVLSEIAFQTEPSLGGAPPVPGSARQVPAWLLASPVLRRLEALLAHRKRGFVERYEYRESPRGRVDWASWARRDVTAGRWATLPCSFTDPDDDPALIASVRWTLSRLDEELSPLRDTGPARFLLARVADLVAVVGPGAERRPEPWNNPLGSGWLADALEAMGWVAEERGLGGSRSLDGMSWDLAIDQVWEAWVDAFARALAPRCGLVHVHRGQTRRPLNWVSRVESMRALIPDSGLRGANRMVWLDAKYKAHLQLLGSKGWAGLDSTTRDAHRADLHQALAYAALENVDRVDSVLAYPALGSTDSRPPAVASISAGRRRVRLLLVGLPFGFRSEAQREQTMSRWRELLAA